MLVANWPYTLVVIMPVNRRLEATDPATAGPEVRTLVSRWGRLHPGRVGLGGAAVLILLATLAAAPSA